MVGGGSNKEKNMAEKIKPRDLECNRIYPGDRVRIDEKRAHVVKEGETLWGIARHEGVDSVSLCNNPKNVALKFGTDQWRQLSIVARRLGAEIGAFNEFNKTD